MAFADPFQHICQIAALRGAWECVEASDGCAGIDGVSLARFEEDLETELARLSLEISDGIYQPLPVVRFLVPKRSGGQRTLYVYAVRDRVAQRAVVNLLAPRFDAEFEHVSFAYRRGRSVKQALAEVERWREAGYRWVVDADISAYFDSVEHPLLLERVRAMVADERIVRLIEMWIAPLVYDDQQAKTGAPMARMTKGLPQGAPIAPMLANLFLDKFDEQMIDAGYKLVRFADDFLLLCKTQPQAESALELTRQTLDGLQLAINEAKTRITDFNAGFEFLGATFVRSLCLIPEPGSRDDDDDQPRDVKFPPPLGKAELEAAVQQAIGAEINRELATEESATLNPQSAIEESAIGLPPPQLFTLRTIYLQEHGAVLRCEDDHLRVCKDDDELLSVPAFKVDQIILLGNSHITTPAMKFCLKNDIPIILLSGRGEFFGTVESTSNDNVLLQQQQFARLADESFVLETARQIVAGKIANCRALLQRRLRSGAAGGTAAKSGAEAKAATDEALAKAIAKLDEIKTRLAQAEAVDEARGYEGAAAAAYYAGYATCFQSPIEFKNRNRRPPLDPVNALLSFGYTLLFYNIYAFALGRGLSPYVGSLHSLRQGHPALCSDLIEEFRAPVVDALVTTLFNKRILTVADFEFSQTSAGKRGCFLTDSARRTFIAQFEQRINSTIKHPRAGLNTTWRGCIDIQIGHYIQRLRGEVEQYLPIEIR